MLPSNSFTYISESWIQVRGLTIAYHLKKSIIYDLNTSDHISIQVKLDISIILDGTNMLQSLNKSINWDNISSYKFLYNQHTNMELAAILADFTVSNCTDMQCKNKKLVTKISNFYNIAL